MNTINPNLTQDLQDDGGPVSFWSDEVAAPTAPKEFLDHLRTFMPRRPVEPEIPIHQAANELYAELAGYRNCPTVTTGYTLDTRSLLALVYEDTPDLRQHIPSIYRGWLVAVQVLPRKVGR